MTPEIQELRTEFFWRLRPIRRRLRVRQGLAACERALPASAMVGVGLGALGFVAGDPAAWIVAVAALAPLVVAAVWGLTRPIPWTAAARAVDQRYALADRTLSAVDNLRQLERDTWLSPIAELQVRDAAGRLEPIRAREVAALRISAGNGVLALALVLGLVANLFRGPENLAGRPAGGADLPPLAAPPPFADLPPEILTQAARRGAPAGPLALKQRKQESYLGDNAATERYFELMDRKSTATPRPADRKK